MRGGGGTLDTGVMYVPANEVVVLDRDLHVCGDARFPRVCGDPA